MTNSDQTAHGAVKVEQRHREAAAEYAEAAGWGAGSVYAISGCADMQEDELRLVQAFARFEASLSPTTTDAVRGEVIEPNSPEEWELETLVFNAANRSDVPTDVRETVRKLWYQFVLREQWHATLHPSPEDPSGGQDA